jgi:hypothetical protein
MTQIVSTLLGGAECPTQEETILFLYLLDDSGMFLVTEECGMDLKGVFDLKCAANTLLTS